MKAAVFAFSLLAYGATACAQNTSLRWYSFSSGFGISLSSSSKATSAIGQAFVGTSQGPGSMVVSGFLADTLLRGTIVAVNEQTGLPTRYELFQNYPNPFNPTTTIKYQIPASAFVTLKVFDIVGREVATLVSNVQEAGSYTVQWNAHSVASGVYFYRMSAVSATGREGEAGSFVSTRKLILLR